MAKTEWCLVPRFAQGDGNCLFREVLDNPCCPTLSITTSSEHSPVGIWDVEARTLHSRALLSMDYTVPYAYNFLL